MKGDRAQGKHLQAFHLRHLRSVIGFWKGKNHSDLLHPNSFVFAPFFFFFSLASLLFILHFFLHQLPSGRQAEESCQKINEIRFSHSVNVFFCFVIRFVFLKERKMLGPICWEMQGVFVLKIVNQQAEHICIVESGESDLKKKLKNRDVPRPP